MGKKWIREDNEYDWMKHELRSLVVVVGRQWRVEQMRRRRKGKMDLVSYMWLCGGRGKGRWNKGWVYLARGGDQKGMDEGKRMRRC